jgi:cyclin-dependent kinase 12/13
MGCVQAKPLESEGSSDNNNNRGLNRFKMENGYVPSSDFVAHRRSTGAQTKTHVHKNTIDQKQPRKHKVVVDGKSGKGKRDSDLKDSKKHLNKCFEDEMVDGWPKWLVDNVPIQSLSGLVPKSAESYKMIDKVKFFLSVIQ